MLSFIEMVNPDLRLQTPARVGDGIDALVVSWPVHLTGLAMGNDDWAGATLFVEPALPTNHLAFRGLSGVRIWGAERHTNLALVLEGGGLLATDGHGAFAGGGPAYGGAGFLIALVARRYFVVGDDRWDFSIDVTLPGYSLGEILGG